MLISHIEEITIKINKTKKKKKKKIMFLQNLAHGKNGLPEMTKKSSSCEHEQYKVKAVRHRTQMAQNLRNKAFIWVINLISSK